MTVLTGAFPLHPLLWCMQGGNQAFTRSGCLDIADSTVEAYDTIFRHTIGVRC